MTLEQAEASTQLRAVVGSTVHGLALEGADDRDEMGVCLEPFRFAAGLQSFEQIVHRTAAIREGQSDAKSQPGDLDLTIYSLRKYVRLALQGNPTILLLLYVPPEACAVRTAIGTRLQLLAPVFASRRAGKAFLGYLTAQGERLLGLRGQKRVRRPDLVELHGYDTKYAMHALRLGYQGVEFMQTGRISLPMREGDRVACMRVRRGEVPLDEVVANIRYLQSLLEDLKDTSPLPPDPDYKAAEEFLCDTYFAWWSTQHEDIWRRRSLAQPEMEQWESR